MLVPHRCCVTGGHPHPHRQTVEERLTLPYLAGQRMADADAFLFAPSLRHRFLPRRPLTSGRYLPRSNLLAEQTVEEFEVIPAFCHAMFDKLQK